jgi:hypothetical protein
MGFVKLLKLSHVPRWAIIDVLKDQSVADHTFRVMAIGKEFLDKMNTGIEVRDFLQVALLHDIDEANTGDIPTPCKDKKVPRVNDLPNVELVLKIADVIEAISYVERYGVNPDRVAEDLRAHLRDWATIADIQLCLDNSYSFCEHLIIVVNGYD